MLKVANRSSDLPAPLAVVGLVLVSFFLFLPASVHAQIYKWVDENGNVHFSDKPVSSTKDTASETVELNQGYTPPTFSEEEQRAAQDARIQRGRADRARRAADDKRSQERLAQRQEQREEQCEQYRQTLRAVTEVAVSESGDRSIYYLTKENGEAMNVAEQKVAVAQLKEKIAREC